MPEEKKLLRGCIESIGVMEAFLKHIDRSNVDEVAKGNKYFSWVKTKTEKVISEETLDIPSKFLPMRIDDYEYQRKNSTTKSLISKYYKEVQLPNKKIHKKDMTKIQGISAEEIEYLTYNLVFVPKSVFWVDFGFNIGSEFGGHHPAVMIRKAGQSLLVVPISSTHVNRTLPYVVDIPQIYGFSQTKPRWTSVDRVISISPKRVDFNGTVGNISTSVFNTIKNGIKNRYT